MKSTTNPSLVLINSGAYTAQELAAEFGPLPPAFLPVGLGRLYELQARMVEPLGGELYITLPESFAVAEWDEQRLRHLNITVIRTPDELSLGAALLQALGQLGFRDRSLRILHGDTLIEGVDLEIDNVAAVAEGGDGYRWGHVHLDRAGAIDRVARPEVGGATNIGPRLCGYFSFSSDARFAEKLALSNGDFYDALNSFAADHGLSAVAPQRWLDFGHVQTFFRSRRIVTTERSFNSLQIGDMHVRKRSTVASAKLRAEARWLRNVPPGIAPFCARVLGDGEDAGGYYYDSEYEAMPTLAELFVFGRVVPTAWSRILTSCAEFIDASVNAGPAASDGGLSGLLERLVIDKTRERLEIFSREADLHLDAGNTLNGAAAPSLQRCLSDIEAVLAGCGDRPSLMHGDFCFSNILYNFRTDRVRLIDPRALTERGTFSLYGDVRYDLAKLMHSVCGRYDLLLAGQYAGGRTGPQSFALTFPNEDWRMEVEEMARAMTMGGVRLNAAVVWAAMTTLFLSMPPLHADRPDRQGAFIANALRLHAALEQAS